MTCDVYLYDDKMKPLPNTTSIEIIESDHGGTKLDLQRSSKLGPKEYGAKLKQPSPAVPVSIVIDDTSGLLAATRLGELNTSVQVRLDVILFPLPPGSGGVGSGGGGGGGLGYRARVQLPSPSPQSPEEISDLIRRRVRDGDWTSLEAQGVRQLVETAVWALSCLEAPDELHDRLRTWLERLDDLGIVLARLTKTEFGSGSGSQEKKTEQYYHEE